MASINKVVLLGHVGREPECRSLPSGDLVASFSIATTETWKDKSGQKQEKTEWANVEVFGKLAEIVRDFVTRGKQVYIEGSMVTQEWEKDGVKKSRTKVKLSGPKATLVLLGGGERGQRREDADDEAPLRAAPSDDFQVSDDMPF